MRNKTNRNCLTLKDYNDMKDKPISIILKSPKGYQIYFETEYKISDRAYNCTRKDTEEIVNFIK